MIREGCQKLRTDENRQHIFFKGIIKTHVSIMDTQDRLGKVRLG